MVLLWTQVGRDKRPVQRTDDDILIVSDKWLNTKPSCSSVFNNNGVTVQPSYRLISVVSHLGQTTDSGHYVCDIWCNESKKWYLCDDESIQQIDEMSVQKKSTTGYTYFYLNRIIVIIIIIIGKNKESNPTLSHIMREISTGNGKVAGGRVLRGTLGLGSIKVTFARLRSFLSGNSDLLNLLILDSDVRNIPPKSAGEFSGKIINRETLPYDPLLPIIISSLQRKFVVEKGNFRKCVKKYSGMTMLVLRPGQFNVKVLYGSENMIPVRRMGILTVCKIASFKALSSFPWLTPSENSMGFWIEGREKLAFLVEFANHEDLKEVHEILKSKLENTQFSAQYFSKHDEEIEDQNEELGFPINRNQRIVNSSDVENIKESFDQFTLYSALEPTAKRPRLSTSLSGTTYGSLQVENPSIRPDNFIERRGMSLADFYEGVSQFTKAKEYNSMTYSQFHGASEHINALGIDDMETSGFMNLGNTCYMNSMLQGLFANSIFTKDLFKFCKMIEDLGLNLDEEMPLSLVIANLASRRYGATNQLKILFLDRIRNMTYFGSTAQQDAHEFLVNILNQIQEECDKVLCKQYEVEDKQERARKIQSHRILPLCNVVTKNREESIILPVSIHMLEQAGLRSAAETSGFLSVQTLLDEYLKSEEVDKNATFAALQERRKTEICSNSEIILFSSSFGFGRYFFNASVAVKRDDKIRIPLYLTLRKGSAKETAPFLALSPTTKEVRGLSTGTVESNRIGNRELVLKSAIPSPSGSVIPETIYTQRWRHLKASNDVAPNNYPSSFVSHGIIDNKPVMESKMDEDDQLVYPVPISRNNPLDHSQAQLHASTASSGDNINLGSFIEALKRRIMGDHEEGSSISSKSVLDEKCGENTNKTIESSTKDDAKAVLTNLTNLNIAGVSRATAGHGEKAIEEVDPSNKVSSEKDFPVLAPYKLAGESRTAVSDRRFYDNTGSHGKLNAVTAAQRFMPNQKFTEANQNYIRGLRSKINVFTSDSKSFQPESLLKLEHPTMSREQKLSNPLFTQRQLNQSRYPLGIAFSFQCCLSVLSKPISKDDYTDEDLRFMTEEEQIMAACERSIDDQLRLFRKDNGISARILRKADERLSMRSANEPVNLKSPYSGINEHFKLKVEIVKETVDCSKKLEKQEGEQNINELMSQKSSFSDINEDIKVDVETVDEKEDYSLDKSKKQKDERGPHIPISQKSSSSDINEDYKVDVETVEETEDCSENFGKQGEQSMHKLLGQNSSSFYINEDIKVDVETVEEKEDYSLDKSKKQKGEKNEDVPTSQKLPAPDINEDIRVDVETIEEKDSSEKYKKQKGEQSTDGPLRQKSLFSSINEDFKVDIEIVENERNYSKRYKMPQDESENSQNFNSNDANEMAPEAMLRECGNNTEYDVTENAKGGRGMEEQINIANANSETVQADGQNISGTGSANTSKSSFKSILSNADTNSSFEYSDTNPSLCYAQTNSEHTNSIADKGGARRKMYLKKNRPPTPPELSFRTKHEISYSDRWTSSRCSGPLLNFKQTMVESKTRLKYSEEAPVYLPPNLTYKDEYSTTLTQPVTSLSFKPSIVGKDFKSPVEPLPSEISDSNLENTENMDDDESSNSDISDDLSSTDGKEILEEIGSVPYKPLCCKMRRAICKYIGMDFNIDWMQEMDIHDRPSGLVDVGGDCNCLFQSLAYYVAGSKDGYELLRETIIGFEVEHPDEFADIKGWTSDRWSCHLNLLIETGLGAELELYAFAAMFCVDVWVFNAKRWLCYRPKFVVGKQCKEINIEDYRIGENEGIYLMYEHNQFLPVLTPSNGIFLNKSISVDSSDTDFMQEYYQPEDKKGHGEKAELLYNMTINSDGDTTGPSYRLISVVSHLGQTANSGHYICDVWCNKSNRWLFCDDGSIRPISQEVVQSRSGIGYIYFYLNSDNNNNNNNNNNNKTTTTTITTTTAITTITTTIIIIAIIIAIIY
ncbi:hypothetical protein DINM_020773 [Dirofilaria immitis]|nr:hypothetical protein [Dirofilaria immitis]